MTGSPIGKSVGAPIVGEYYWIHLAGTPEGKWVVALRRKFRGMQRPCWDTFHKVLGEQVVDQWLWIPPPATQYSLAEALTAPVHDA